MVLVVTSTPENVSEATFDVRSGLMPDRITVEIRHVPELLTVIDRFLAGQTLGQVECHNQRPG